MCFIVLRHLLASRPFTPVLLMAIALVIIILLGNALWSILFFSVARPSGEFRRIHSLCCCCRDLGGSPRSLLSFRGCPICLLFYLPRVCDVVGLSFVATQYPQRLTKR